MSLNETNLEKKFNNVSTSQGSIQSLSFFCLHYKNHHEKIAHIWLRCLQKAKVSHRLTLIYLANDIVQNAKRKNTPQFIDMFKMILKDTVPYLRDEKIKKSVERVFSIWQDRAIYDAKFTNELKALLNDTGRQTSNNNNINKNQTPPKIVGIDNSTSSLNSVLDFESEGQLNKVIDESVYRQKRLLMDSEDQLTKYKSHLDSITKHRDEIMSESNLLPKPDDRMGIHR